MYNYLFLRLNEMAACREVSQKFEEIPSQVCNHARIVQQGSVRTTFNSLHAWNCLESYFINQLLTPDTQI